MPPKAMRPPNRGRRAIPTTISAPVGGLNGRDSFVDMPPNDAFVLDNFFPSGTSVDTRGGSLDYSTGITGPVESLKVYTGAAGAKMLSFADGKIFNSSAAGAVGAALVSGRASNKVSTCMFSNAGSQFLLIYSGADAPLSYDGAALTALVITGLTGSQNLLLGGMVFKGRVFLRQKEQLGFYYLAVGAIQGAAVYFDLQQQSLKGGALAAMTTFSQDSGVGPADYAVFVTTEGEYIMYAGTDPSNAATWALVGRYLGPPIIARDAFFNFRSDVYFVTTEGILSLTQIRQMGEDKESDKYLTAKLGRHYTDAVINTATHGWGGAIYPRGSALMVNVPLTSTEAGGYAQFVMNTNTNAWCRFIGLDGICWALFNGRLYFGSYAGKVVLADEGVTDNGMQVQGDARQAWNTFDDGNGAGEADKQFHFAVFSMSADGVPSIACVLNVNFEDDQPGQASVAGDPAGEFWDAGFWDTFEWAGSTAPQSLSVPVGKLGYICSVWMRAASVASKVRWFATRIIFEKTRGVLLQ